MIDIDVAELDYLHDVVYNATNKSLSNDELMELVAKIPTNILFIALEWGFSDTIFRNQVFEWLISIND